jgi:hypothetical protein
MAEEVIPIDHLLPAPEEGDTPPADPTAAVEAVGAAEPAGSMRAAEAEPADATPADATA